MDVRGDSRPSIDIDSGEEAVEMWSGVGSDCSAVDSKSGVEGHGDSGKGLPDTRVEDVEGFGSPSTSIAT